MPGLERLRQRGLNGWRAAERLTDSAFGSAVNPLRHLGAVGMLAFWLVSVSGIVLYIAFGTSVQEAHSSVEQLAGWPLATGTLLRGVHRYGTDLLVVAMFAHLVREWLHGHERGFRRYSWLTGVVPIGFVFIAGIGGYWLPWDQLAQYSALATAEWFDALPGLFATPFARNFLGGDAVDDRLFSLFVFVHIGVSLLLLFVLWFHLQRLSRTAVWPPSPVAWGLGGGLVVLSLAAPVLSHAPAELARVPAALRLDWFVLFVHPLVDATSAAFVWIVAGAAAVFLFGLPFFGTQRRAARAPVAVVDPANCNGCRRCQADCPYAAVTMVPHPNQRIGRVLAVVDPDLCAGCGICAGSCPSSTPFRSARQLVTGIDMPQLPVGTLRQRLQSALAASRATRPLVLFGCDHGAHVGAAGADDVCTFGCLCAGQLPPSFVEYALRDGAAGVLVAPCRTGGCAFRLGDRWTRERLAGQREPHLRASVAGADGTAGGRLEIVHAGLGDEAALAAAVQRLRERVSTLALPSPDIAETPDAAHLPDAAPPRLHHA